MALLAEAQLGDDGPVALYVLLVQVRELPTALTNHFEESSSRVVVVPVYAQMLRQVVDPVSQHCNLKLHGTCVRRVVLMLADDVRFALLR